MEQFTSQCTNCGAFTRWSPHLENEYQSSVLERPATEQDISHIRHTILPTINSRISSLQEVIRSMEAELERLINVQKRYTNLISLGCTLPSEIWSEIFLFTTADASNSERPYSSNFNAFNASGTMWLLSHVCQRWRNIVLSLGSFWSTIYIRFPDAAWYDEGADCLEAVLQRSRQCPLDVSLEATVYLDDKAYPSVVKGILDFVVAESYRLRALHLLDYKGTFNEFCAQLRNRLPRLQTLKLDGIQIEPKEQSVFKVCPRLTNLSLASGSLPVLDLPWGQILELDLSRINGNDKDAFRAWTRSIGLCTSLETISTRFWFCEHDELESPYPHTTWSSVRKLNTMSVRLVDALTLPCLREAFVHPDLCVTHSIGMYSLKRLLIRSNCLSALTSLSLAGMALAASPDHTFHSILCQTINLTSLNFEVWMQASDVDTNDGDEEQIVMIMKSLEVIPAKTVTFLPRLSSLDIQVSDHRHSETIRGWYYEAIRSFASTIEARWRGDDTIGLTSLKTCHLTVEGGHLLPGVRYTDAERPVAPIFDEAEGLLFTDLVEDGMDLTIRVTSDLASSAEGNDVVLKVP